ncbi:UNVERIFIED_CONTAM: hypothetical protein Sindi_0345700 [Sesamum indicum]
MEETTEKTQVRKDAGSPFFLHNPCNYFQETIRSVLRCLGFESQPENYCSNDGKEKGGGVETSSSASSAEEQLADPQPSSAEDPSLLLVSLRRRHPQPPIEGGSGPGTNATST